MNAKNVFLIAFPVVVLRLHFQTQVDFPASTTKINESLIKCCAFRIKKVKL